MPTISPAAGKVICDAIHTAEITYRDSAGNVLFTQKLGACTSGGMIETKVPEPGDLTITMS